MSNSELELWENLFQKYFQSKHIEDKSHDLNHFKRVWRLCIKISEGSDVNSLVLLAGSYFHDLVNHPKNSDKRNLSSRESAVAAEVILLDLGFPVIHIENVKHCIESHSYSAEIEPLTIEAKILQDADRMESLGAIGLARTFYVAGRMGSSLFDEEDPFAVSRELDDKKFALDHFRVKLYKIADMMNTEKGKIEALKRVQVLKDFMSNIEDELII